MAPGKKNETQNTQSKEKNVRLSNIMAAKAVSQAVRTSLGPRGMDKMVETGEGDVLITNDGATILKEMQVLHPAAKMLVELSKSQDIEAGDGTTSVVVIAGGLLDAAQKLLDKGIHPTTIAESFMHACRDAVKVLEGMAVDVDIANVDQFKRTLVKLATTSLSSKVVSQHSKRLSDIAVESVLSVIDAHTATNVDLRDVKIVKKLGGTLDDTELVHGLVFNQGASGTGPRSVSDAKIALIQFCVSPPKTDIQNTIAVSNYQAMDRVLKEEQKYVVSLCKKIKKSGCNVLMIQKSILRDAITDMALHILGNKMKIMVIRDIERTDIEFIAKTIKCKPVAEVDQLTPDMLGSAGKVEEVRTSDGRVIKVTGVAEDAGTVSVLMRASNKLILDEAERSLHDALCVVRSLVKKRKLLAGGGAAETEVSLRLAEKARTLKGKEGLCYRAFAEAFEVVPYTLAENAGLNPIEVVTELRNAHATGENGGVRAGINVRSGKVSDMIPEDGEQVVQPLLVSTSAFTLAAEVARMIVKIDDMVMAR